MTPETVMTIGREALQVTLLVSAPLLISALAAGLLIAIFQAATQINEMTLTFIPKILAIGFVLLLTGPWMLQVLMDFMRRMITEIPNMVG